MNWNWKKIALWVFGVLFGIVVLLTGGLFLFKDKIIGVVVTAVNDQLNTKVDVKKIDLTFWRTFPDLSIEFDHLFIKDTYPEATDIDTLFYTEKLRLRLNPIKALKKEYTVDQIDLYPGVLHLKVNERGEGNYAVFKSKDSTTSSSTFDIQLKKIFIKELRFKYDDKSINQSYATDLLNTELEGDFTKSVFTVHAKSEQIVREIRVGNLNVIRNRNAMLDITVQVNQTTGSIIIPQSTIFVDQLPFQFQGFVREDSLQFKVNAQNLSLTDVARNLNIQEAGKVSEYAGKGKVTFDFLIEDDRLNDVAPVLECQFGVKNGELFEPTQKIKIKDINIDGEFSNRGGSAKEHLTVRTFAFNTASGPFNGALKITEFNNPRYTGKLHGVISLGMLQTIYPIAYVSKMGGTMDIDSQFDLKTFKDNKGKLQIDPKIIMVQSVLQNASIQLQQDERLYEQINGAIDLNATRANVRDLSVKVKNSDLTVNGTASNLIAFLNDKANLDVAMALQSRRINFLDFYTETAVAQKNDKETNKPQTSTRQNIFPHNIVGAISLKIGTVDFRSHLFENVSGTVQLNNRTLDFSSIQFKTSGAQINGSLKLEERSPEFFQTSMRFTGNNIDLSRLLKDWNNFDQNIIKSENITGNAQVNLQLNAPFDMRTGINHKNIHSTIQLRLIDGRLKGVEVFDEITKNLKTPATNLAIGKLNVDDIGNRLKDIQFKTIENTIEIANGIIRIPNMVIENSLMNIKWSGTHDFDNNIDYHFGFRFRDLKRDITSEFGNVVDDETGVLVFLRMYGNLSHPKFTWDKEAKKQSTQEYNKQEKENIKSMLKTDLGLFKKDSTVKKVETKTAPRETVIIDDGKDEIEVKKKEKGKVGKFFEKLKNESEGQ